MIRPGAPQRLRGAADPRVDRDHRVRSRDPRAVDLEPARGHGRQVARHRLALGPAPGRPAPAAVAADEGAVRDRLEAARNGDRERVGRLVGRVVVAGEPGRRALRLGDHDRPVAGREPSRPRAVRVAHRPRSAPIADHGAELRAGGDPARRGDDELLARALVGGLRPVDADRGDPRSAVIEVERAQVLRGDGDDSSPRPDPVGARSKAQLEVVLGDVVTAVAGVGEERIADPGRAGRKARRRRRREQRRARGRDSRDRQTATPCPLPHHSTRVPTRGSGSPASNPDLRSTAPAAPRAAPRPRAATGSPPRARRARRRRARRRPRGRARRRRGARR